MRGPTHLRLGVCLLNALLADWKMVLAMGGAAIAALAMIAYAFFRPAANPEDEERRRRLHLNQIGRIAEGQIVELVEHPPESKAARKGLFGASPRPLLPPCSSWRCPLERCSFLSGPRST